MLYDVEFQAIRASLLGRWGVPGEALAILTSYYDRATEVVDKQMRLYRIQYLLNKGPDDDEALNAFHDWVDRHCLLGLANGYPFEVFEWDWNKVRDDLLSHRKDHPKSFRVLHTSIKEMSQDKDREDRGSLIHFKRLMDEANEKVSLEELGY